MAELEKVTCLNGCKGTTPEPISDDRVRCPKCGDVTTTAQQQESTKPKASTSTTSGATASKTSGKK